MDTEIELVASLTDAVVTVSGSSEPRVVRAWTAPMLLVEGERREARKLERLVALQLPGSSLYRFAADIPGVPPTTAQELWIPMPPMFAVFLDLSRGGVPCWGSLL